MSDEQEQSNKTGSRPALLAAAMAGGRSAGGGSGRRRDIVAEVLSVNAKDGTMRVKDALGEMVVEVSSYTVDRM